MKARVLGCLLIAGTMATSVSAGTLCGTLKQTVGGWEGFTAAVDAAYDTTIEVGFGLGMWATLMDTSGRVCYVYSVDGEKAAPNGGLSSGNNAWLGSRIISAQKANTANAFSLDELSIPTGAISVAVYPGGSLYGLQHSNPVDAARAYRGQASKHGTESDPLVNARPGGVNVFGGGIALYDVEGIKIGAIGVSGDTSCRDASMAFNTRMQLGLDNSPNPDVLTLVAEPNDLFQQPLCGVNDPNDAETFGVVIAEDL